MNQKILKRIAEVEAKAADRERIHLQRLIRNMTTAELHELDSENITEERISEIIAAAERRLKG